MKIGKENKENKREIFLLQKRKLRPEPPFLTCHRRPAGVKNYWWPLVVFSPQINTIYPTGIKVVAKRRQFELTDSIQPPFRKMLLMLFPWALPPPPRPVHLTGIWATHLTRHENFAGLPQSPMTFNVWKVCILPFYSNRVYLHSRLLSTFLLSLQEKDKNTFSELKV